MCQMYEISIFYRNGNMCYWLIPSCRTQMLDDKYSMRCICKQKIEQIMYSNVFLMHSKYCVE